jgi:hypothetical protein
MAWDRHLYHGLAKLHVYKYYIIYHIKIIQPVTHDKNEKCFFLFILFLLKKENLHSLYPFILFFYLWFE